MKILLKLLILSILSITSCKLQNNTEGDILNQEESIQQISEDVSVLRAVHLIDSLKTDLTILDVRTPEEIADGKIFDALEINFRQDDFESHIDQLDKSKNYLVYCGSGKRSSRAANMMLEKGFARIYNLADGYTSWEEHHEGTEE